MASPFDAYLRKLREIPLAEHTEHTGRSAIEALLNQMAPETGGQGITVQHEPKRESGKGAPDFKISRQGMILGYVEVKEIGTNLDKVLKSDQIKRYRTLSDNILITDYLQWIWIDRERVKGREILAYPTDLEGRTFRITPERADAVQKLIAAFFSEAPQGIGRAQQLALALATRSQLLRDYLGEELVRQEREHKEGRLYGLFQIFRDQIFHELTIKEFADAFAQMLAYGLFLARLNSDLEPVTLYNARQYIPGSFRLIRELVEFLTELTKEEYRDIRWVVEEVLSIVNGLDLPAIHEDLSFRQRKAISRKVKAKDEEEHRLFERDPFIYFYEDYLKAYDPAMRKGRGVYYTPPPIVNFIIRAVDDILKESFGIREGLADNKRVTVLDFACGTATFLLEVFQRIFDNIGGPDSGRADPIVREHFLKNIFGFEYLIAPYTIAHLKLSQFLNDKGHPLKGNERLQVFLTNTLEPIEPQANFLLPAISAEVKAAQTVKEQPILVITGNPPYSGISRNMGAAAQELIERYKYVDGQHFGERKHWLQDDYVKFIAFAQKKMDEVEEGIVGIITNHSFLNNPTFRGMRQSLMSTFHQIYVLNLHGNTKKREQAPDGMDDQNVFDIQQGVAVSLFVRRPDADRGVWYADLWGSRLEKYRALAERTKASVDWQELKPVSPYYFFVPFAAEEMGQYDQGWRVPEMFAAGVSGIVTARDGLTIHYSKPELKEAIEAFCDPKVSDQEISRQFGARSNYQWKLSAVRERMAGEAVIPNLIQLIAYQPFDARYIYNDKRIVFRPRAEIMRNMERENTAIITNRSQEIPGEWTNVLASDSLVTHHALSLKEVNYLFPLYLYSKDDGRSENLSPSFRAFIDSRYEHHYTPEEILGYIYAVLYAPTYRSCYAEFLRIDFPRIPFPEIKEEFEVLSKLGWALAQAHLLRELPRRRLAAYQGKGDHRVEAVRYSPEEEAVWINKTQCFKPVPQNVWDFHIGGYQVLDKYLKSRKGRVLSLDEINHFAAVADSLAFTIDQMAAIDKAYRAAFPDRG